MQYTAGGSGCSLSPAQQRAGLGTAGRFVLPFALVVGSLALSSFLQDFVIYARHGGYPTRENWIQDTVWLLEVTSEKSFYTWASSSLIFLNAVVLLLIATHTRTTRLAWSALCILFFFLSMDEALSFHERLDDVVHHFGPTSGAFHYAWVIPGMAFCVVVGLAFSPFLWSLPRRTMILFVVAGGVFVSGAIGFEMLGSRSEDLTGIYTMTYQMLANVEETLEGVGMLIFLYALVDYGIGAGLLANAHARPRMDRAGRT